MCKVQQRETLEDLLTLSKNQNLSVDIVEAWVVTTAEKYDSYTAEMKVRGHKTGSDAILFSYYSKRAPKAFF